MSVTQRLALAFSLILALLVGVIMLSIYQLDAVARATETMMNAPLKTERLVSDWYRNVRAAATRTTAIARSSDSSLVDFFKAEQTASSKDSAELLANIQKQLQTPKEKALMEDIDSIRKVYLQARDEIFALKRAGKTDEANKVLDEQYLAKNVLYLQKIDALLEAERKQIDELALGIQTKRASSSQLLVALGAVSVALGAVLSWLLAMSIVKPLARANEVAQRVAEGDLGADIPLHGKDEVAQLLTTLKRMQSSLVSVVSRVRQGAESVSTASSEIAVGNHDLSSRTENQASALQETAASMHQLSSTVRQNADSASQANQLAITASKVAIAGGEEVSQVVATMKDINDASRKISDIISVIDGIAFQTNILALNAAVEAARAGEQGRGFAVVASEVRSLASRSAAAAKEIKTLINASVERVERGTALVDRTGVTMSQVVESIQRATQIMGEISAASKEQAQGVAQVGEAVQSIDQVTQQNAALVEEMAAATSSLKSQSEDLVLAVAVFKIPGTGARALP
ncbi:methyl-accepting chemotaxis protein [Roseateles sp. SL47]|uniref:methyl-accepting chemotaxis protein n=1 Tax=Roseateles sp. SL47 TaxID=2995138 RepID=UPI00227024F3|nr:methyl-accepting chemotaxis protein [Roseateles sp. SL47]WAC71645.1 methyl-accepting chemotaxis protein [Roseateles sp. SL47]